jgi:hypothetical protein
MNRYRIEDHPYDRRLRAEYGHDPAVGWFVLVYYDDPNGEPILRHDASNCGCAGSEGVLGFLTELRFFADYEVDAAVDALASPGAVEVSPAVKRVMQVVRNLRADDPSS